VARDADVTARVGGDEFMVLLIDCDADGARRVALAVQEELAKSTHLPDGVPTVSIGAATMPHDAETVESLTKASDVALYAAKVNGRNRVIAAREAPSA
jgi:diguanylate cyclase (GGDEF)-like protein